MRKITDMELLVKKLMKSISFNINTTMLERLGELGRGKLDYFRDILKKLVVGGVMQIFIILV